MKEDFYPSFDTTKVLYVQSFFDSACTTPLDAEVLVADNDFPDDVRPQAIEPPIPPPPPSDWPTDPIQNPVIEFRNLS